MNWDVPQDTWRTIARDVRREWPELTAQDIREIAGRKDRLIAKIVERYEWDSAEADRQIDEWSDRTLEEC